MDCCGEAIALYTHIQYMVRLALSVAFISNAKREEIEPEEYARQFQSKYFEKHQEKIYPKTEERYLRHRQNEMLSKLKAITPSIVSLEPNPENSDQQMSVEEEMFEWFESPRSTDLKTENAPKPPPIITFINEEDFALKNLIFVESMLTLQEESKQTDAIPSDIFHSLLYDKTEFASQQSALNMKKEQYSEDSGFGSESLVGLFSDKNDKLDRVKCVPSGAVNATLQTMNSHHLVLSSMKSVVKFIKTEINTNPQQVFHKWEGSIVEFACDLLKKCACNNSDCNELLLIFIFDILESIWNDLRICQHRDSEMKIYIISAFLANCEVCCELLLYITEKLEYFTSCIKNKSVNLTSVADKSFYFIKLYSSVCKTTKILLSERKSEEKKNISDSEECDITKLWTEKWCLKDEECESEASSSQPTISIKQIEILERLLVPLFSKFPLIYLLTEQALRDVKDLKESISLSKSCTYLPGSPY